jgi:conjugal transfer pilus assembly protein TraV
MQPTMRRTSVGLAAAGSILLGGCAASLTGVGGSERFACQAPVGAQCTSISGVHANASALTARDVVATPSLMQSGAIATHQPPRAVAITTSATPAPLRQAESEGSPAVASLRAPPRVVRLWIAPWEDADGDLHEASLVHVVVDTGRWLIERVRPAARSRIDIATPPPGLTPSPAPATETRSPADHSITEP